MRFKESRMHREARLRYRKSTREIINPFTALLDSSFWVKHPAPFSKTRKGKARRDERQFVRSMDQPTAYLPPTNWSPSAFLEHRGEGRYV